MASLSFHDYVSQVLPKKQETKNTVLKYTQELCDALEESHLSHFADDDNRNKSSFRVQEQRKYFRILEDNPVSWYQECLHVFVNKETGHVHAPTIRNSAHKKIKFDLLSEDSRKECMSKLNELNAHLR